MYKYQEVTITIRFRTNGAKSKDTLRLRLGGEMFRRVGLYVNGKFEQFAPVTKIITRIRKIIVEFFNE